MRYLAKIVVGCPMTLRSWSIMVVVEANNLASGRKQALKAARGKYPHTRQTYAISEIEGDNPSAESLDHE